MIRPGRRRDSLLLVAMVSLWLALTATTTMMVVVMGQEEGEEGGATATDTSFNAKEHMDWGTYYDPKNIFCGKYDCYKILGFDYENFGAPDAKVITKRYRSLSREWHPDKSKHKDAKERFVKIARAYEVLTNEQQRAEYDYMRYNQEAYYVKYGTSVLWNYAPKSDATFIIFVLMILGNVFTWFAQQSKWQNVADRLIKAAVEDWSPSMGGSPESKQLRQEALKIMETRQNENNDNNNNQTPTDTNSTTTTTSKSSKSSNKKSSSSSKLSGKEKKKLQEEQLRPIVTELVQDMHDFGAGFHKPTWKDLLIVRLVQFPIHVVTGIIWQTKYYIRRLQKLELNDEEKQVLTERAVGHVSWECASDDERQAMIARELWIMDNLVEWKEEEEVKTWSKSDQKYYNKMKKKGIKDQ